mgnify:CR=1 FL=1
MVIPRYIPSLLAALVLAVFTSVPQQVAAESYPTFTIDLDQSEISVTTASCASNCGVAGSFSQSGEVDVNFSGNGDVVALSNLIQWTMAAPAAVFGGIYNVTLDLFFSAPDEQASSTKGGGLFWSFLGIVSGGTVAWIDAYQTVSFDQGSDIGVWLEKGSAFSFGKTVTSDVYLVAENLVPLDAPAPTPVPPLLPVLALALGGLFYWGKRQKPALSV